MKKHPTEKQLKDINHALSKAVIESLMEMGNGWKELSFFNGHKLSEHEKTLLPQNDISIAA